MGSGSSVVSPAEATKNTEAEENEDSDENNDNRKPPSADVRTKRSLRSVGSFGRKGKRSSLKSVLSEELDHPEIEKLRKEFEMYLLDKENEIITSEKIKKKLESENRRLRAELQALEKMVYRLKQERDTAQEAELRAVERAAVFEADRNKIQKQFKLFRETRETELHNLLKAMNKQEAKLMKVAHLLPLENSMDNPSPHAWVEGGGNCSHHDNWTSLDSEHFSFGSNTELQFVPKGIESPLAMMESDKLHTFTRKEEYIILPYNLFVCKLLKQPFLPSNIRVFITASEKVEDAVPPLLKMMPSIDSICDAAGSVLTIVYIPKKSPKCNVPCDREELCKKLLSESIVHINLVSEEDSTVSEEKSMTLENSYTYPHTIIVGNSQCKCIMEMAQLAFSELKLTVSKELCCNPTICNKQDLEGQDDEERLESDEDLITIERLCSGCIWDAQEDYRQLEFLHSLLKGTECFEREKQFQQLTSHVLQAGPLSPLLVLGTPGSGKSTLLAKWLASMQGQYIVLFHFVSSSRDSSACPGLMMRRLLSQLMSKIRSSVPLTTDPSRLNSEFPQWLEKLSSKLNCGIILVLDSIDRFKNAEEHLYWLLDPLPVDIRVIVSADQTTCLSAWRSWPTIPLEPLSIQSMMMIIRQKCLSENVVLTEDQESRIATSLQTLRINSLLLITVIAASIARNPNNEPVGNILDGVLGCYDVQELFVLLLDQIREDQYSSEYQRLFGEVLSLIISSCNGVCESDLFKILPNTFSWEWWDPLLHILKYYQIVDRCIGLITIAHEEARIAIKEYCFKHYNTDFSIRDVQYKIIDFHQQSITVDHVKNRVVNELPKLLLEVGQNENLHACLSNVWVFLSLFSRGRSSELLDYWQFIGEDRVSISSIYLTSLKKVEDAVMQGGNTINYSTVANLYEALGHFLQDLGLLSQALSPLQRALEIRETLDPDHPNVARSLFKLACLHAQWGKLSAAEELYKQALKTFSSEHYLVGRILEALIALFQKQGKHTAAEPLIKRCNAIKKKNNTPNLYETNLYHKAIHPDQLSLGDASLETSNLLNEVGVQFFFYRDLGSAENFFRKSLEMCEAQVGQVHLFYAQILNNLAGVLAVKGDSQAAEDLYQRALNIRTELLSPEHPAVVAVLNRLTALLKHQGKFDQVLQPHIHLLELRKKKFGQDHPLVATAMVNLAVVYSQQNKHAEALPLYEDALKIYTDTLGSSHPQVAKTLKNLALLRYEQGDFETAAKHYKNAVDILACSPLPLQMLPYKKNLRICSAPNASRQPAIFEDDKALTPEPS